MNTKVIMKKNDLDFKVITKVIDKTGFDKIKDTCVENGIRKWNIASINNWSHTIVAYKKNEEYIEPVGFINANRFGLDVEDDFIGDKEGNELFEYKGDSQVRFNYDSLNSYVCIDLVYVNPEYRLCGIGTMLYKSLEETLSELDCIYESQRSIDGRNADLIRHIKKCMTFKYHEYEDMLMNL